MVFWESMPGLSERVFKLPSIVQISAGSSRFIWVNKNFKVDFELTFQFKVIHGEVPALLKNAAMGKEEENVLQSDFQDFYGYTGYAAAGTEG